MNYKYFFTLLSIFFLTLELKALTDSNLPIVIITTDNNLSTGKPIVIPDEPKVLGNMKIIYRPDGSRNYLTDQNTAEFLNYSGRIGIENRGSSSLTLEKKSYSLTTLLADNVSNNNVKVLGMPAENDWVLNSLAFDPSLIRDLLSYNLSTVMGNYASRGVYCEVIVNGDYRGLYIFMEKLKIDNDRINILKLTPYDNSGENLTGGYITKCDKIAGIDVPAWNDGWGADFIHESPKPYEITTQQKTYIKSYFTSFYNAAAAKNSSIINGYPSLIDVPSFVDFMIMNELSSNPDGYQFSTYFHKDRNGKLRAGPIWDFNLTYGNDLFNWGFDRSKTNVWQFNDGGNTGAKFWRYLFEEPTFKCYLTRRWLELTALNQPLNYNVISNNIDQLVLVVSEASVREEARWHRIGNHATHISDMKTWIQSRMIWLNTYLNNYQTCINVQVPKLVISKIHYHPAIEIYQSDSLEFIEITNNSNITVNLTGIYFSEPGISYQFPVNSSVGPKNKIILTSNTNTYKQYYGATPFGQFTRSLSNKSQKLILSDAFGNTIDEVCYADSAPWPLEADGGGAWLELIDLFADNSLYSNWKASNVISDLDEYALNDKVKIFPNPTRKYVYISCEASSIVSYKIEDFLGRNLMSGLDVNSIDIGYLPSNIYVLTVHFKNGTHIVKKIVKSE